MASNQDGDKPASHRLTADSDGPDPGSGVAGLQIGSSNVQVNNYFYGKPAYASGAGIPVSSASEADNSPRRGHAFISYVREDSGEVDVLQHMLEAAGIPVWRDTASLWPGEDWRAKIRGAITRDALVFIVCFSNHSSARQKSYQNEELRLAIDQLRQRQPNEPWLIPVRLNDCEVPDFDLGTGQTLSSIHRADLFGADREKAAERLVAAVQRLLSQPASPAATAGRDVILPKPVQGGTHDNDHRLARSASAAEADGRPPGIERSFQGRRLWWLPAITIPLFLLALSTIFTGTWSPVGRSPAFWAIAVLSILGFGWMLVVSIQLASRPIKLRMTPQFIELSYGRHQVRCDWAELSRVTIQPVKRTEPPNKVFAILVLPHPGVRIGRGSFLGAPRRINRKGWVLFCPLASINARKAEAEHALAEFAGRSWDPNADISIRPAR